MKYENTKKLYLVFFISNNIWIIFTNIIVDAIIYDILRKGSGKYGKWFKTDKN